MICQLFMQGYFLFLSLINLRVRRTQFLTLFSHHCDPHVIGGPFTVLLVPNTVNYPHTNECEKNCGHDEADFTPIPPSPSYLFHLGVLYPRFLPCMACSVLRVSTLSYLQPSQRSVLPEALGTALSTLVVSSSSLQSS